MSVEKAEKINITIGKIEDHSTDSNPFSYIVATLQLKFMAIMLDLPIVPRFSGLTKTERAATRTRITAALMQFS